MEEILKIKVVTKMSLRSKIYTEAATKEVL